MNAFVAVGAIPVEAEAAGVVISVMVARAVAAFDLDWVGIA